MKSRFFELKTKGHLPWYWKYILVLGVGVLVVVITLIVTSPALNSDTDTSKSTMNSEISENSDPVSEEPESSTTHAAGTKSNHSKSSIVLSQEVPGEIIDSLYQKVDLDWINAFLIVMYTYEVKTDEKYPDAASCMSIIEISDSEYPIMMIGGRIQEDGYGHYTFYGYQNERLYRLLEFEGYAACDPESSLFTLCDKNGDKETYLFHDMNFYRQNNVIECDSLPLTHINDGSVYTVENLPEHIIWMSKGGDSE